MDRIDKTWRGLLIAALLSAATLAAFWPVLHNEFIKYDDDEYVTSNPHVLRGLTWEDVGWAFQPGYAGNWHPVTWLSHMLDVELFGLEPGGHHLMSLLLHLANTLLLWLVLRRLTGAVWRSAFVAALFALHPLHVESVAWVAERKDVLSTFFFMLTLWAYSRYVESKAQGPKSKATEEVTSVEWRVASQTQDTGTASPLTPDPRPSTLVKPSSTLHSPSSRFYLAALAFFALGLMSKPMLVTVPFLLLLLDFWPLQRLSARTPLASQLLALLREKVPFLCLAAVSSLVTVLVQSKGHAVVLGLPLALRLANAAASYLKYLGKMFWPANLSIYYPHPDLRFLAQPPSSLHPVSEQWPEWLILAAALLLAMISVGALLSRKRAPWFVIGWFWYLGMLVPVIGVVQVGTQAMADRYSYLPLIGLFICLVWGAAGLLANRPLGRVVLPAAGLVALAACLGLTHRQVKFWRTNFTLFDHALDITPNNAMAHCQVGTELEEQGKLDLAIAHFQAAMAIDPSSLTPYYGLGFARERQGKMQEAAQLYRAALQREPWNRWGHHRLAVTLWALGKRDDALAQYAEALRLDPDYAEAHYNLGLALAQQGKLPEATVHFAKAARLNPNQPEPLTRLAEALLEQGKLAEAQACYTRLVRLDPTNAEARINLGGLLWRRGQRGEALAQYVEAVRLQPAQPVAHYNLGTALFAQGRLGEAAFQFGEAARLKPDYTDAFIDQGRAQAGLGEFDKAQASFREAVRLCPTNANLHLNLGTALMMAGHTNQAAAAFAEALRLEPDQPEKLVEAGKALAAQGQLNAALARFKTALWLKPDSADAHENLAQLLTRQGKPDEAAIHLQEAARLRQQHPSHP